MESPEVAQNCFLCSKFSFLYRVKAGKKREYWSCFECVLWLPESLVSYIDFLITVNLKRPLSDEIWLADKCELCQSVEKCCFAKCARTKCNKFFHRVCLLKSDLLQEQEIFNCKFKSIYCSFNCDLIKRQRT